MSGTKTQASPWRSAYCVAAPIDDRHVLKAGGTDGDHEPAAVGELLAERVGDGGGAGGHENPVERRVFGPPFGAVADVDLDVGDPERVQHRLRARRQHRVPLDRHDARREPREDGRLVAGARADLEDAVRGLRRPSASVMTATM